MPDLVHVLDGVVTVVDGGVVLYRTDPADLEQYLLDLAIAQGYGRFVSPSITESTGNDVTSLWLSVAPNPGRDHMMVRFAVPTRGAVRIDLYDIAGRCVRSLVDRVREAGNGSLIVDRGNLPSGVYILQMRFGKTTTRQRLIFVK
jgi:hypothetical protein